MKNSKKAPKINPVKVINPYARALLCVTNPNIETNIDFLNFRIRIIYYDSNGSSTINDVI